MKNKEVMFNVLYQDNHVLVVQTHAGEFDKWGDDLYGSFNVALHVFDEPIHVLNNRMKLLSQLNAFSHGSVCQLSWLEQTHGDEVVHAHATMNCQEADALMTDEHGVGLCIMTADCVPIVLFSQDNTDACQKIACIHAGWQGLTKGIIAKTHQRFHHKKIQAVIGACISQARYEIDQKLAKQIVTEVTDKHLVSLSFDELYQKIIWYKDDHQKTDKCFIDLVELTKLQLSCLNIELMSDDVACSYDTPNLYSYRQQVHAHKPYTGRMATIIMKI